MENNILFIENSLLPSRGGIEKVTYKLSDIFQEKRYTCFFAYQHVDYENIPLNKKIKFNHKNSSYLYYTLFSNFIKDNNINIVIIQGITQRKLINALSKCKKTLNIKIIFCLHNTPYYIKYLPKPSKIIDKLVLTAKQILYGFTNPYIREQQKIYKLCDQYVVLSPTFIEEAKQVFILPDIKKITCIRNPLIFNTNKDVNINQKKNEVIIITRFDENQKNIIGALNIWKKINAQCQDWHLKIVGYGEDEVTYKKYIELNSIKNVDILGKTENPQIFYNEASIFMMTSKYEGLAVTLMEALQYKCIPLAYDSFSSIYDIIIDGVNGFIIPAFKEDIYVNKLLSLIQDVNLRKSMMDNSSITLEKYKTVNITNEWMSLLNEKL